MTTSATANDVLMPRLTDSMEEGTIAGWLKGVGDAVAVGDELVEIETDKATVIFESEHAGTLLEIVAAPDAVVAIGGLIARIGEPGAAPPTPSEPEPEAAPEPAAAPAPESSSASAPGAGRARTTASPVARRLAAEHDLDLTTVEGSGPGGRITKADVEAALATAQVAAPGPEAAPTASGAPQAPALGTGVVSARGEATTVEPTALQRTVALRMSQSKATAPHFSLECTANMSRLVEARRQIKESKGDDVVPSFNDVLVKAVASALRRFPRVNGAFVNDRFELYSRVNVGIAVAAEDALVVPTIFDADAKTLTEIAIESRRLAEAVRTGKVTPAELEGGTFTVSNLGMFGIASFQPVINPPQAGILAVGAIEQRPVVEGGQLASAHLMDLTLACDHRILYGADGARFLDLVRSLLEEPLRLVQ